MKNELLIIDDDVIKEASKRITSLFPDNKVLNNLVISNDTEELIEVDFSGQSAKRSFYEDLTIAKSNLLRNAFSGTIFYNVNFKDDIINGNSFVSSNFYKFILESTSPTNYEANNFSDSYFNCCKFKNATFISSTWLNSKVINTQFNDCTFLSCTMESALFNRCELNNVEMYSANLDYMIFKNSVLKNVVFPFYQFAYIIGIKEFLNFNSSDISFKANDKNITLEDYKKYINDLIYYYYDLEEFFPISNLLISIDRIKEAKEAIIIGVNKALSQNNYKLVKHFCNLCKFNNLQTYDIIKDIKTEVDAYLLNLKENSPQNLNEALIQTAEITAMLDERVTNNVSLNFEIQTNIERVDSQSQERINKLIGDCKYIIDNAAFENDGHTLTEISYCPTSLIFNIIGDVASLLTIGMALQQFIVYIKTKRIKNTRKIAENICSEYSHIESVDLDTTVELAKERIKYSMLELKTYKGKKSGTEYEEFISSITQKIIGNVDEITDSELLVFKIQD